MFSDESVVVCGVKDGGNQIPVALNEKEWPELAGFAFTVIMVPASYQPVPRDLGAFFAGDIE